MFFDYQGCHELHQHKSIWNWQKKDQVSWKDIQAIQRLCEGKKQEDS
jgi:hypothetical protein